ncbi:hypothetical protein WICPIJ_000264 [Wickerhamomyces pijperi]|uniref:Protein kinase domain-containing protein n=1 Tax=Wickerhamomyces pijperi TaxID=599730 RepID=A0A9P8QCZ4_WICPI|nr:hypothetical protein WICPIJ_000264 [Wickerhamomyces pijperi]
MNQHKEQEPKYRYLPIPFELESHVNTYDDDSDDDCQIISERRIDSSSTTSEPENEEEKEEEEDEEARHEPNYLSLPVLLEIENEYIRVPVLDLTEYIETEGTTQSPRKLLGRGGYGAVRLGQVKKQIPTLCRDQSLLRSIDHSPECNIFNRLKGLIALKSIPLPLAETHETAFIYSVPYHPNLLQVHSLSFNQDFTELNIVTEKMSLSLADFIKRKQNSRPRSPLPMKTIKSILLQIASGLAHMNQFGYMHCDLKPGNILLTKTSDYYSLEYIRKHNLLDQEYVVKICDYGQATNIELGKTFGTIGTPSYNAPEITMGHGEYDQFCDIWSLGCIMYTLMSYRELVEPSKGGVKHLQNLVRALGSPFFKAEEEDSQRARKYRRSLYRYPHGTNAEFNEFLKESLPADTLINRRGLNVKAKLGELHIDEYNELCPIADWCLNWDRTKRPSAQMLAVYLLPNLKTR